MFLFSMVAQIDCISSTYNSSGLLSSKTHESYSGISQLVIHYDTGYTTYIIM